jgi:hypothetical protein
MSTQSVTATLALSGEHARGAAHSTAGASNENG